MKFSEFCRFDEMFVISAKTSLFWYIYIITVHAKRMKVCQFFTAFRYPTH